MQLPFAGDHSYRRSTSRTNRFQVFRFSEGDDVVDQRMIDTLVGAKNVSVPSSSEC